jgi:hypothetical protein
LEARQIIAGFTDIKAELIRQTGIKKEIYELHLHFTLIDGVLYAHDRYEHAKCIAIAVKVESSQGWSGLLKNKYYGSLLIKFAIRQDSESKILSEIKDLYKSNGFIPFNT